MSAIVDVPDLWKYYMRKASQRTTWNRKGEKKLKTKPRTFLLRGWYDVEVKVRIKARQIV